MKPPPEVPEVSVPDVRHNGHRVGSPDSVKGVEYLSLIARVLLGLLFTVSGGSKLFDRSGTRKAVIDFGLPMRGAGVTAIGLPAAELSVAGLLLWKATARLGAFFGVALLGIFCVGIVRLIRRGESPECNCFGQVRSAPVSKRTLVRNVVFMIPGIAVISAGPNGVGPSAVDWVARERGSNVVLASAFLSLFAFACLLAVWVAHLARTQVQLRLSVDVLEQLVDRNDSGLRRQERPEAAPPTTGLPIGSPAPIKDRFVTLPNGEALHFADALIRPLFTPEYQ